MKLLRHGTHVHLQRTKADIFGLMPLRYSSGHSTPGGLPPRLADATADHPTSAGLRIGKKDDEGCRDGDGQYFHYLTKHAFALNRLSLALNDPKYNEWAVELLEVACRKFVYRGRRDGVLHMYWKMSMDLNRPLVHSEGNLDPYDGLVTVAIVRAASPDPSTTLMKEYQDFHEMVNIKYNNYKSQDPLDLGEALWLTHWKFQGNAQWANEISKRSAATLEYLWLNGYFTKPLDCRLAFREFGTTLGTQVNPSASNQWPQQRVPVLHAFWAPYVFDRDTDISPVMMAASLVPGVWDNSLSSKYFPTQP
eukprot:CFRG2111T1